ncbi:MAG: hypothetical protein BGP04_15315 [Rhizobiales bacterium 62-17]|nr:MAG: hypothetical protein BGP04_15315 [Rhizobiales bacterium 62-17]
MAHVAAIILAAGLGSRYRAQDAKIVTKVLADLDGRPLVRHVIDEALCSRCAPVVVVTGYAHEAVEAALADADVSLVHNPDYETGLASSLRRGVGRLPVNSQGAIVLLADMPKVSSTIINRLIEVFIDHPDADAVVPVYNGARGNPVLLARSLFPQIMQLKGDQGAKPILEAAAKNERIIYVPMDNEAVATDVDTPDALDALRAAKN